MIGTFYKKASFVFVMSGFLMGAIKSLVSLEASVVAAQTEVQKFINNMLDRAVWALEKEQKAEREQDFLQVLEDHFDHQGLARYMLGGFYAQLNEAQKERYTFLLKKYMVILYLSKFDSYGEKLPRDSFTMGRVFPLQPQNPKSQWIAKTMMQIESNGQKSTIDMDWRVYPTSKGYKILDVFIEGVSLSQTKREEFVAAAGRDGVDAFLNQLAVQANIAPGG